MTTAFVLGGGGVLGATEVGMLRALLEQGITPDLVVGSSIGSVNGAFIAADPSSATVARLEELWIEVVRSGALKESPVRQAARLAKHRTHVMSPGVIPSLVREYLDVELIEDLPVPFQCVAAEIESARSRWFSSGPIAPAVAASCAVPGLFAAVEIDGKHYLDGGLVHSIPVGRALELGATRIYVLHVGRVEQPLSAPTTPWDVGLVSFEIARRHRFVEEISSVPDDVELHVLPSGVEHSPALSTLTMGRGEKVTDRIRAAYEATAQHLTLRP